MNAGLSDQSIKTNVFCCLIHREPGYYLMPGCRAILPVPWQHLSSKYHFGSRLFYTRNLKRWFSSGKRNDLKSNSEASEEFRQRIASGPSLAEFIKSSGPELQSFSNSSCASLKSAPGERWVWYVSYVVILLAPGSCSWMAWIFFTRFRPYSFNNQRYLGGRHRGRGEYCGVKSSHRDSLLYSTAE